MKLHLWYHNNALASTRCLESHFIRAADKGDSLMLINASHIKMDVNTPIIKRRFSIGEYELRFGPLPLAPVCCHTLLYKFNLAK